MNNDDQHPDHLRYQSLNNDGQPVMFVYAHPDTPSGILIEMLEEAINSIKSEKARTPAKVVNLADFRTEKGDSVCQS